jgi:predicted ribosome quality control (RQC) complex YloA/Tae2 family protein
MVKAKVRFDGLDVTAMVAELNRSLLGRRVINIYHEGSDCYIIKLDGSSSNATSATTTATATGGGDNSKSLLLLESGIRFHATAHPPSTATGTLPPPFCSKLRKHLRGLRLERIAQLGLADRVVHLVFGSGEQKHSLILELYARGNLILTSAHYEILALLRSHEFESKDHDNNNNDDKVKVKVGHVYPVTYATSWGSPVPNEEGTDDGQDSNQHPHANVNLVTAKDGNEALVWAKTEMPATSPPPPTKTQTPHLKSKKDGSGNITLKMLLLKPSSGVSHFGPSLLEHCILTAELTPNQPMTLANLEETISIDDWTKLVHVLRDEGDRIMNPNLSGDDSQAHGYILYRPKNNGDDKQNNHGSAASGTEVDHNDKILEEFQPQLLKQHLGRPVLEYSSFSEAVDDFFFHLEGQKRALRAEAAEATAKDKLEKIRRDQEQRVESLEREQERLKEHAEIVALNADDVDKALSVINAALNNGVDWEQLEQLVRVEQANENPIALLIHKLDLEHDAMVLKLPEDTMSGEESNNTIEITVMLSETAHGNASHLFAQYRSSKEKAQKTVEASAKALKAAEEAANRQLAEAQKRTKQTASSSAKRKTLWFEKFHWFITSDNYLVLGGRDAQQNEQLVKRYLRPGDAYLHADVHGAASCILRAKRRRTKSGKTQVVPLSDQALREAGSFTICRSSAWASKIVTSAWWVESHQVSKTAPTGEYLSVGSFMVRGKKNFLPPTQLEMGMAVLFRLGDDDSILRHRNERRDFALLELEQNDNDVDDEGVDNLSKHDDRSNDKASESKLDTGHELHDNKLQEVTELKESRSTLENDIPTQGEPLTPSEPASNVENPELAPYEEIEPNPVSSTAENLEPASNDDEKPDEIDEKDESANASKKKGLSVRERKLLKKYGSLEAAQATAEWKAGNDEEAEKDEESTIGGSVASQTLKRGKKAKLKKLARKYADQDEEEREWAMLALQGGEKSKKADRRPQPTVTETQQKAAAETAAFLVKDSEKVAEGLPVAVRELLVKCLSIGVVDSDSSATFAGWSKLDADVLEHLIALNEEASQLAVAKRLLVLTQQAQIQNFSSSLAGILRTVRKYGYENLEKKSQEISAGDTKREVKGGTEAGKESWKQVLAEEGLDDEEIDDDAIDDTVEISKLTGKPQSEDTILYAIPVCAPYSTVAQYAFRVKLTPGNLKRGKAAKQCVDMLVKPEGEKSAASDRYRELIKKVGDNDWVQAICSDVKISAPGASKVAKAAKSTTKKHAAQTKKKKKPC